MSNNDFLAFFSFPGPLIKAIRRPLLKHDNNTKKYLKCGLPVEKWIRVATFFVATPILYYLLVSWQTFIIFGIDKLHTVSIVLFFHALFILFSALTK